MTQFVDYHNLNHAATKTFQMQLVCIRSAPFTLRQPIFAGPIFTKTVAAKQLPANHYAAQ